MKLRLKRMALGFIALYALYLSVRFLWSLFAPGPGVEAGLPVFSLIGSLVFAIIGITTLVRIRRL